MAYTNLPSKLVGCSPFGSHHHIIEGLIPEVVATLSLTITFCPGANEIEVRIEKNEVSLSVTLSITHYRYHNIAIGQAVGRMGSSHIVALQDIPIDDLHYFGLARIRCHVQYVNEIRIQCWQYQTIPLRHTLCILVHVVAAGAGIPAGMMQLVALAVRKRAMDNLCEQNNIIILTDRKNNQDYLHT